MCYSISEGKRRSPSKCALAVAQSRRQQVNDNHRRNTESVFCFFRERKKIADYILQNKASIKNMNIKDLAGGYLDFQHHPVL